LLRSALISNGYKHPFLEIASPTSTAKKTLVLLDTAPDARTHRLQFSLVWADAPKSIDLFPKCSPYFQLSCASISTSCACERPTFCARPTFGDFGLIFSPLPHSMTRLEARPCGGCSPSMLARVLVDHQRLSTVTGEGKISLSLQNCLMDLDSIRRLRDRLGPDVVDIT
jgi:hypothetical protein